MKILHIPNYYKPHTGGIEQVCHDITDTCLDHYEQKVVCFSEDQNDKHDYIDGVEVYKCGVWKKIASQAISFSYHKILKQVIKDFNPDLIIFHYPNPFVARYLLKYIKPNMKLLTWYHLDITKQKHIKIFFNKQSKRILERSTKIVATSPIYAKQSEFLPKYADKVVTIPCCISEERLKVTPAIMSKVEAIKKQTNLPIVFAIGRHVEYKGLRYLIEAAKYMQTKAMIYIAGKGPLTAELMKLAAGNPNIVFLGRISDEDLVAYYNAMAIYAFPSITKNEAFGISLAEAMYFAKPTVTFTIPGSGVNYVAINNETGLEVENSNAKELAKALDTLISNPELCRSLGQNAKKRVQDLFMFAKFKEATLSLLKELE